MIEVICGNMYSGKSFELIRRVSREVIAKKNVLVFKPSEDVRYAYDKVVSHFNTSFPAIPINMNNPELIVDFAIKQDVHIIGIDEAQFFSERIVDVCKTLSNYCRVIVAGLDLDFKGDPFGSMPTLLALADRVDKLTAICMVCGQPANRTQRLSSSKKLIKIGGPEEYEARCLKHWTGGSYGN